MTKIRKYFPYVYILFLTIGFFYVRNVINSKYFSVEEVVDNNKTVEDVKPVDIKLVIDGFNVNNSYETRKESNESFDDFLEALVEKGVLTYEKTEYTYGTVYDLINGEKAPEGYVWKIYIEDEEITYKTKGIKLSDDTTYYLRLEKE